MNRNDFLPALLLIAVAGLSSCSSNAPQTAQAVETVRNVSVVTIHRTNIPDAWEAVGTVRAVQTSVLASQTSGIVVEVRVHEGDRVQRGQVLAIIDDTQPRAAVDRASAATTASQHQLAGADSDLALADSTLKRYQTLYERKSVSAQEFDEVKTRQQTALARRDMARADLAQAEAALAQARTSLDYTRIRAPFGGVITEKKADAGTLASPGLPIFTMEDVRNFRLEVSVNESELRAVRIGNTVPIHIEALGNSELKGKVAQIVPAADPGSRSFLVKVDLPTQPDLRSGLFGSAAFSRGEKPAMLVPRTSIVERGQLQGVFVLDQNSVAALRYITLGKATGENIEVLAGLQPGERLVVNPGSIELAGRRIEARP